MGSLSNDDAPHLNMIQYWHETFEQIFEDFSPDEWRLEPTNEPMPKGWRTFKDSAKVKFACDCDNSWTSMKGVVIFWFNKIGDKPEVKQEKDQGDSRDSERWFVNGLLSQSLPLQCDIPQGTILGRYCSRYLLMIFQIVNHIQSLECMLMIPVLT